MLVNRRERLHAATEREIRDTARAVLIEHGPDGLALRAIARQMGMSAPSLYRYVESRDHLIDLVVADIYNELREALEQVRDTAEPASCGVQFVAVAREFRRWAVHHTAEFGLLFGAPIERLSPDEDDPTVDHPKPSGTPVAGPAKVAAMRFGEVFADLVSRIYLEVGFPVRADDELAPNGGYRADWGRMFPDGVPLGVLQAFLSGWIRLYGMVSMEVFGHLTFALDQVGPTFETELRDICERLGVLDAYALAGHAAAHPPADRETAAASERRVGG
jgi:AcrR family transcriptional regulator